MTRYSLGGLVLVLVLVGGSVPPAHATIPVVDVAAIGQLVQQITMWVQDAAYQVKQIANCSPSNSSSSSSSSSNGFAGCLESDDVNITVMTSYNADGNISSITAMNAMTGNQTTEYLYGTTLTDSARIS